MSIFVHSPNAPDQKLGPLEETVIRQMLMAGQITSDQLAWKQGLTEWVPLKNLLQNQCPQCATSLNVGVRFCPKCGVAAQGTPPAAHGDASTMVYPRNPPLSPHVCWLNIILSGTAQMLHGQIAKGIFFAIVSIIAFFFGMGFGGLVVCFISIVDAYKVGKVLKSGRPVNKWEWWPK